MLIGAHVSPAGGLPKAIERGVQRTCDSIQIFNQSPRAWKASVYDEDTVKAFRKAMRPSRVKAVLIHAVYLLNCASEDRDIRAKTLASLTNSLRAGEQIGAVGVVLHPGSAKTGDVSKAIARSGKVIAEALAESGRCPLYLESMAGTGGTLGRSIEELERLIEAGGGAARLGVCLDSCHLFASGYDIRTPAGIDAVVAEVRKRIGLRRLGALHLNDSQTGLSSNRDRHADIGEGEIGDSGLASFLAAPAFKNLPCVLETPGPDRSGPTAQEIEGARKLLVKGQRARSAAARRSKAA